MKVQITVDNVVTYSETVTVIQPSTMKDDKFEEIIGRAESSTNRTGGTVADFIESLSRLGLKVENYTDSFPDSPNSNEVEIIKVTDIKE